jgi:hypothetical protein
MAEPHGGRFAAHGEFDSTAKAATFVFAHNAPPSKPKGRMFRERAARVNRLTNRNRSVRG